jgi:hypothetical protein
MQFSIKAMLILVFGVACFCAGWRERERKIERDEARMEDLWAAEKRTWADLTKKSRAEQLNTRRSDQPGLSK